MGNISSTQFVGTGNQIVAQLYEPCHLFGDADLFGPGIRYGLYGQYIATFYAIVCLHDWKLKAFRASLIVTAIALFVSLCFSSTGDSLVILDWTIISLLVFNQVFYTILPLLVAWSLDKCIRRERRRSKVKGHFEEYLADFAEHWDLEKGDLLDDRLLVVFKRYLSVERMKKKMKNGREELERVKIAGKALMVATLKFTAIIQRISRGRLKWQIMSLEEIVDATGSANLGNLKRGFVIATVSQQSVRILSQCAPREKTPQHNLRL